MEKYNFRALLLRYWKQNLKATEAARKNCEIEGDGVLSARQTQNWFNKFNDGDLSLEEKHRSARPVSTDLRHFANRFRPIKYTHVELLELSLMTPKAAKSDLIERRYRLLNVEDPNVRLLE